MGNRNKRGLCNHWEFNWVMVKTNLRVTNKMVLPTNTNLKTINGESLIELRESGNIVIGGNTTTLLTTATTDTTIVDVLITGTVVGILGDGGQTWITGFTSVGNTVTLTDGTSFAISQPYLIFIQ